MPINERYLVDRTRIAATEEILETDASLFADLTEVITAENILKGLRIDFGADKKALDQTLTALGITDALKNPNGGIHIHGLEVSSLSSVSGLGSAIRHLEGLALIDVLDMVQINALGTIQPPNKHTRKILPPDFPYNSAITLMSTAGLDEFGNTLGDFTKPAMRLHGHYNYAPEFTDRGYFTNMYFADLVEDSKNMNSGERMQMLIGRMSSRMSLSMPSASYLLDIGYFNDIDLAVDFHNRYWLSRGRISRIPDRTSEQ